MFIDAEPSRHDPLSSSRWFARICENPIHCNAGRGRINTITTKTRTDRPLSFFASLIVVDLRPARPTIRALRPAHYAGSPIRAPRSKFLSNRALSRMPTVDVNWLRRQSEEPSVRQHNSSRTLGRTPFLLVVQHRHDRDLPSDPTLLESYAFLGYSQHM